MLHHVDEALLWIWLLINSHIISMRDKQGGRRANPCRSNVFRVWTHPAPDRGSEHHRHAGPQAISSDSPDLSPCSGTLILSLLPSSSSSDEPIFLAPSNWFLRHTPDGSPCLRNIYPFRLNVTFLPPRSKPLHPLRVASWFGGWRWYFTAGSPHGYVWSRFKNLSFWLCLIRILHDLPTSTHYSSSGDCLHVHVINIIMWSAICHMMPSCYDVFMHPYPLRWLNIVGNRSDKPNPWAEDKRQQPDMWHAKTVGSVPLLEGREDKLYKRKGIRCSYSNYWITPIYRIFVVMYTGPVILSGSESVQALITILLN